MCLGVGSWELEAWEGLIRSLSGRGGSEDNGLTVGGLAAAFPLCSQQQFPWHPDTDLATSVCGDSTWESLSPSLSPGQPIPGEYP